MTTPGTHATSGVPSVVVPGDRGAGGLVAVHAHPDDETLATGALLATWARSGAPVTVVTCTRGERGEVIDDRSALEGDGPRLAEHRTGELADALAALGVTGHVFLDEIAGAPGAGRFEDSGMAWLSHGVAGGAADVPAGAFVAVPLDDAAERLVRVLLDRSPAVVVTYEPGGGYGHPDHVRAHEVTMRAVALLAARGAPVPVVLWAAQGRDALRRATEALAPALPPDERFGAADGSARRALVVPDAPAMPGPSVVVDDGALDVVVDVRPVLPAVLDALRAHATQVQAVRSLTSADALACYALSNDVLAPVLPVEAYRVGRGDAGGVAWPDGIRTA